jgi:hypothetical protein
MTATTRRAAMTALASVPALAIPALAAGSPLTASPNHPDAEIFALIKRCREVDKLHCAASEAADKMLWTHVGGAHPPKWTDADASVLPDVTPGDWLHPNEIGRLRACLALPTLFGELNLPPQAFAERAREIVATHDDYVDRLKAAHEHPDVVAATDEKNARGNEWFELAGRLAETPAKTVDGMVAKLAMVAIDMVYEEDSLSGGYEGIAASAALDAVRLRAATN